MKQVVHFAEVIESSLIGWTAQSWEWDVFPPFGSIVTIQEKERTLFGIVHQVQTGSIDPTRSPFTYQKTAQELQAEQPQIFAFLKTTFLCVSLGYIEQNRTVHLIAPQPPKIHAFVNNASLEIIETIFKSHHYLYLLFNLQQNIFNLDELLLALLWYQKEHLHITAQDLQAFMKIYTLLIGNDYRRLKLFFARLEQLL